MRIPIFQGLVPSECQKMLHICKQISVSKDAVLYEEGDPGTRLFILLQGEVLVQMPNGKEVAHLYPIDTIGEMEIASAQTRSARVVALTDISGMEIYQNDLESLFDREPQIGVKVLRNIINALAHKLAAANQKLSAA
ncbi:MAG: cyclic nucleotide-binding domain-containing protein [Candidatus Latescibacteria bacterium]|nr:cyclic nucleotide-binding domain-containing protein [Candidatus Latescibacterota bacterium]